MDCTGSMGGWIAVCKKEILSILEYIKESHKGTKIRISYVGYRDHCDKGQRFITHDFSDDVQSVKKVIDSSQASGGGDAPEDIAGALKIGAEMKWESEARYCVLIADAPCHGTKYHGYGKSGD